MSGYIGPIPVPQGIQNKETFTATAGQTTFNTNGYTDGAFISVYLNGVRLVNGTDYTSTNGSDVVLASGANAGDVLDFETFNSFSLASQQFENITTKNPTHEDTDGGRESAISFKGEQSGGEISTLAQIQASHDGTSDDQKGDLIFKTNDGSDNDAPTEAMRIDSDQQVGIGSTPTAPLDVRTSGASGKVAEFHNNSGYGVDIGSDSNSVAYISSGYTQSLAFKTDPSSGQTERMRIDSSGNLLHSKTSSDGGVVGHELRTNSFGIHTVDSAAALYIRRLTNDGTVMFIQGSGGTYGAIGVSGGNNIYISGTATNHAGLTFATRSVLPSLEEAVNDDGTDLGQNGNVFRDIYAGNTSISTSDEREKQQIASLTDAEIAAAKSLSKLFKTFKWNSAVETKGDNARIHTGVVSQQIEQAMTDAGLDVGNYAFFVSGTWWETQTEVPAVEADEENGIEAKAAYTRIDTYQTEDEAPEGATERNRKGIRYPELLAFIGAATEQRLTSIEARLDALEAE